MRRVVAITLIAAQSDQNLSPIFTPAANRLYKVNGYRLVSYAEVTGLVANANINIMSSLVASPEDRNVGREFLAGIFGLGGGHIRPPWLLDVSFLPMATVLVSSGVHHPTHDSGWSVQQPPLIVPCLYVRLDLDSPGLNITAAAVAIVDAEPIRASLEEVVEAYKLYGLDARDFQEVNPS